MSLYFCQKIIYENVAYLYFYLYFFYSHLSYFCLSVLQSLLLIYLVITLIWIPNYARINISKVVFSL